MVQELVDGIDIHSGSLAAPDLRALWCIPLMNGPFIVANPRNMTKNHDMLGFF